VSVGRQDQPFRGFLGGRGPWGPSEPGRGLRRGGRSSKRPGPRAGRGPPDRGPPDRGPLGRGPPERGLPSRGPPLLGPEERGPPARGPLKDRRKPGAPRPADCWPSKQRRIRSGWPWNCCCCSNLRRSGGSPSGIWTVLESSSIWILPTSSILMPQLLASVSASFATVAPCRRPTSTR